MNFIVIGAVTGIIVSMFYYRFRGTVAGSLSAVVPYTGLLFLVTVVPFMGLATFLPSNRGTRTSVNQSLWDDTTAFIERLPDELMMGLVVMIVIFFVTRKLIWWNEIANDMLRKPETHQAKRKRMYKHYDYTPLSHGAPEKKQVSRPAFSGKRLDLAFMPMLGRGLRIGFDRVRATWAHNGIRRRLKGWWDSLDSSNRPRGF